MVGIKPDPGQIVLEDFKCGKSSMNRASQSLDDHEGHQVVDNISTAPGTANVK